MTLTYAGTYSSDRETVRHHIADTTADSGPRPAGANYTDELLDPLITAAGSWQKAVAMLLDTLATEWSKYANIQVGPRREDYGKIADAFSARAKKWREDYGIKTGTTAGTKPVTRKDGYSDDKDNVTQ